MALEIIKRTPHRESYFEGECGIYAATVVSLYPDIRVYAVVNDKNNVMHYIMKSNETYFDSMGVIDGVDEYIKKLSHTQARMIEADSKTGITIGPEHARLNGDHEQFYSVDDKLRNTLMGK